MKKNIFVALIILFSGTLFCMYTTQSKQLQTLLETNQKLNSAVLKTVYLGTEKENPVPCTINKIVTLVIENYKDEASSKEKRITSNWETIEQIGAEFTMSKDSTADLDPIYDSSEQQSLYLDISTVKKN